MAFTANIKTQKFNNSKPNNGFVNTFDRLVTVTGYETVKGYMYAVDEKGKKYEVFVNPEENRRAEESVKKRGAIDAGSVNNWMGHSIDENMKKAIPEGSKVILLRAKTVKVDKIRDLSVTEIHRIGGVPSPEADKTFQGLFTMTYYPDEGRERISRVQHWNPVAVDIQNTEALAELKEAIDAARANYGQKMGEYSITEPTYGVQFRALMKTDREYEFEKDPAKKTIYEVVDMSLPFDWIPGAEDEEGKQIKSLAHVITGDEMMSFAEMYADYISENPAFKDQLDNMLVEVCTYQVYPASKNDPLVLTSGDPQKDKNADKNPLYQLSHRKSFIDLAQTESLIGKNAAVNGIIQLSGNKLAKVNGKAVEIPTNWVSKLHANNTRGHIHAFIRTSEGFKTEPHPSLALIKDEKKELANSESQETEKQHSYPSQSSSSVASATPASSISDAGDAGFDPFATEPSDPFASQEETVVETPKPEVKSPPRFGARKDS